MTIRILPCVGLLLTLAACTVKPKLLPNATLIANGPGKADQDIEYCIDLADTYSGSPGKWQEGLQNTAKASVIGSAAGAVGGAIVHSAGQGTAIGAASAAVASILNELYSIGEPNPTYKRFVEYCLTKMGYEVAGW